MTSDRSPSVFILRASVSFGTSALLFLSLVSPCRGAEPASLAYQFVAGQTNVYAVEGAAEAEEGSVTYQGNVVMTVVDSLDGQATLGWRGMVACKPGGPRSFAPGFGGFRPRVNRPIAFAPGAELGVDSRGRLLSVWNDAVLPLQAGELGGALVMPLPANQTEPLEFSGRTMVPDEFPRPGRWPTMAGYYDPSTGMPGRSGPALVSTTQTRIAVEQVESAGVALVRETEVRSLAEIDGSPRFLARVKTKGTFDPSVGLMREVSIDYTETTVARTVSRRSQLTLRARLLEGEERLDALRPFQDPAGARPKRLNAEEARRALADLRSGDPRGEAGAKLAGAEFDTLPADLADQAAELLSRPDSPARSTAARILAAAATPRHVPLLLKHIDDADWSVRDVVIEALGRLKDKRAIRPLTDLVAQGAEEHDKAVQTLIMFGPAAEEAALDLLKEKNLSTRRGACGILRQIGTTRSLRPLQEAMIDPNNALRHAASEAVEEIRRRQ